MTSGALCSRRPLHAHSRPAMTSTTVSGSEYAERDSAICATVSPNPAMGASATLGPRNCRPRAYTASSPTAPMTTFAPRTPHVPAIHPPIAMVAGSILAPCGWTASPVRFHACEASGRRLGCSAAASSAPSTGMSVDGWSVSHSPDSVRKPGSRTTMRYSEVHTQLTTVHASDAHRASAAPRTSDAVTTGRKGRQVIATSTAASGSAVQGRKWPRLTVIPAARDSATATWTMRAGAAAIHSRSVLTMAEPTGGQAGLAVVRAAKFVGAGKVGP